MSESAEPGSERSLETILDDNLQPPMANGEVLFEAPWQGRVFAMAVALHEAGVFTWSEFQNQLIEVIGAWDRNSENTDDYEYYDHFQAALQQVMVAKGVLSSADLEHRQAHLAALPHGHDH
jgi:nitrile hydratase accessory protein